jgi:superfamily II DNA or RNA helicase
VDDSVFRFFNSGGRALESAKKALQGSGIIRIATAYFEPSGYRLLRHSLEDRDVRILIGYPKEEPNPIQTIVGEFMESLGHTGMSDKTETMMAMREALSQKKLVVSASLASASNDLPETGFTTLDARSLSHHAKLYMGDSGVLVTSANLSYAGLVMSREAGYLVTDTDDRRFFTDRFDEFFNTAESLTDVLLDQLEAWLTLHSPYMVYMRSLLELYGFSESGKPEYLPALAAYQKPVAARVFANIRHFGGAMLVASTGLGKTIMAAHIAALLRSDGIISSAIVISPAGLRELWRRAMRAARLSSVEYSYNTLSGREWRLNKQVAHLEHELGMIDSETLIVIDESHHLRNENEGGEIRLRNERIQAAVKRGAKILLLTATPYSRGVDDINNQLKLLPPVAPPMGLELSGEQTGLDHSGLYWKVDKPAQLSLLAPAAVLTAPTVVRHFSYSDDNGERYVLFSGESKRYFPRKIHIRTVTYPNLFDDRLVEILKSGILYRKEEKPSDQASLFGETHQSRGVRDPLFETRLMHQFCSSFGEVRKVLLQLRQEGGYPAYRFERQDELTKLVDKILPEVENAAGNTENDGKITALLKILRETGNEKVVVFCVYRETARYLYNTLKTIAPEYNAATTLEMQSDEIERILKVFAPVANEAAFSIENAENDDYTDEPNEGKIRVLIATGALAEGYNLQDASVLVNFDMPWTVLVMAQRMGRILRPWKEPREIAIYNLIPSTMNHPEIRLAMNWKKRLQQRSAEYSSFSRIPVIVESSAEQSSQGFEMFSLADALSEIPDAAIDIEEAIGFIENADELRTSPFLDDLSLIDEGQGREIKKLPAGFRSYKKAAGPAGATRTGYSKYLYLLIRYHGRYFPAMFTESGAVYLDFENGDKIMEMIRSEPNEPAAFSGDIGTSKNHADIDPWIDQAAQAWARKRKVDVALVQVICAMALL